MAFRINPAFRRHLDEANLIGHLLASFGEIELTVCKTAGMSRNELYDLIMTTADFSHDWKHVDAPLLTEQVEYFGATMEQLEFIHNELAVLDARLSMNVWPRPTIPRQPPLHNPEEEHVPPWLREDQKALHIARALASRGGPPTPTPAQQALDKARAEKRAGQAEQVRKSREGVERAKGRSDPPKEE